MKIRRVRNARFLSRLWECNKECNKKIPEWLTNLKKRVDGKSKMDITSKSIHSLKEELSERKKTTHWKASDYDGLRSFKSYMAIHQRLTQQFHESLKEERIPTWITKVRRPWFKKSATTKKKELLIITGLLGLWF